MASLYRRTGAGRSGNWLCKYRGADGRYVVRSTKTSDKQAAARIATQWESQARLRLEGVVDHSEEVKSRQAFERVETLISGYESKLKAANRTPGHIEQTIGTIRKVAERCGWRVAKDISADALNRHAATLKEIGLSSRTIHRELGACKSFSAWLYRSGKLPADPLRSIQRPNPKADRRHRRRMLLPLEWNWLAGTLTDEAPTRRGMTPKERRLCYRLGIESGLRANELRSLTVADLHPEGEYPFVTLREANTKNRKACKQYLTRELAAELMELSAGKPNGEPLFSLPSKWAMAKMLRGDLLAARTAWLDDAESASERATREQSDFLRAETQAGTIDFHALRHTCGAWLAKAGERPQVIQSILRHSTITLTMDCYGHLFPDDIQLAIGKVQPMVATVPLKLRQAGESRVTKNVTTGATKSASESMLEAPAIETALRGGYVEDSPEMAGFMATQREPKKSECAGTRTRDLRIKSPLQSSENTGNTASPGKRDHRRYQTCAEIGLTDRLSSAIAVLSETQLRQVTELAESLALSQSLEEASR